MGEFPRKSFHFSTIPEKRNKKEHIFFRFPLDKMDLKGYSSLY